MPLIIFATLFVISGTVLIIFYYFSESSQGMGVELPMVREGKASFYTPSGTNKPGREIPVLWEFQKPYCSELGCSSIKVYIKRVEIEATRGRIVRLGKRGWFSLKLPIEPGVYAFPITLFYWEVHPTGKKRTFKNETDVLYFVAPEGATCKYKFIKEYLKNIPHKIENAGSSWVVKLDASSILDEMLPGIECSDGKTHPFRGMIKNGRMGWDIDTNGGIKGSPPYKYWKRNVYNNVIPTTGLGYTDLIRMSTLEVELKEPGIYSASFCLSASFHDEGGNDDLYIELQEDSFPFKFTAMWFGGCAKQEIRLPPDDN
ncbi:MAG: hypothetical protein V2G34_06570 [bacterium JZ-2024 1]